MAEAFIFLLIGVIAFIVGLSQSSEGKKVTAKTEEIVKFASDYHDNLDTLIKKKILNICGADFFMFDSVSTDIVSKKLSAEYEELLIKLEVLKKEDDIRLFGDEEIEATIGEWTKITLAKFIKKSNMSPDKAMSVLKKWIKGRSLISIVRSECDEKYGEKIVALMQLFSEEDKHTLTSCEYTLEEMKKAMQEYVETFEKELISIKDKYLTFSD